MTNPFTIVEDPHDRRLRREIVKEQVRRISLAEYQPGSPRLERLYAAIERTQRFSWPADMRPNV